MLMTNFDLEYLKLCKKILADGVEVENRTGINTIKIPSHTFEFDLKKEFPILTTKQTFFRQAILEMLWIWQVQSNDVRWLQERGVHIWDEWEVDEDGIYRIYEPVTTCYESNREVVVLDPFSVPLDDPFGEREKMKPKLDDNGKVMVARSLKENRNIKAAKYYGKEYANTIGSAYGWITKRYNHAWSLINTIKNNPIDRRMVKLLWQNEFLQTAVLPSCVWGTEWDVTNGTLNLLVHQRSCDVPLGLPFNVTQYATFLKMIAQVTDLEPGSIAYSIKDAHIYVNQINGIKEQLAREKLYNTYSLESINVLWQRKQYLENKKFHLDNKSSEYQQIDSELRIIDMVLEPVKPTLELDNNVKDFFEFDNSKELKHVKVKNYKHMGKISFPVAQ